MHSIAARLDDIGKPAWIALIIVSFIIFWPLGFLVLGYLIGSGRMGCWMGRGGQRWQERMQEKVDRMQQRMSAGAQANGWRAASTSSGNRAFDEYRIETLRRLEEEERQFKEFLDRLRKAKDKAEFDQFMAEMRRAPETPVAQPGY
jgi:hypothetical protein